MASAERPYHALLEGVVARQAELVARWLLVGFIHGVMNTDNTSISGETIDYGPCAFMDEYNPAQVFSSIDEMGRYAYANQPQIALWNLTRLAECLLPLFSDDKDKAIEQAQFILGEFAEKFTTAYQAGLRKKIGLFTQRDGDEALMQDLLDAMAKNQADFTLTFRRLSDAAGDPADDKVRDQFTDPAAYDEWAARWRQRAAEEPQSAGRAAGGDARGQSGLHPAQPPRGGRDPGRRERRLRAVRGIADGAVEAVRRPAGVCSLCRAAAARAARTADLLRDVRVRLDGWSEAIPVNCSYQRDSEELNPSCALPHPTR